MSATRRRNNIVIFIGAGILLLTCCSALCCGALLIDVSNNPPKPAAASVLPTVAALPTATVIAVLPSATPAPTPTADACVMASAAQMENITAGMIDPADVIKTAWTAPSSEYRTAWFIAAYVYEDGATSSYTPAVWIAYGEQDAPKLINSVGEVAPNYSLYPVGEATLFDSGASAAFYCAAAHK